MGYKYEAVKNFNPGPGDYKPDQAEKHLKPRVPGALIKEDVSPERRPAEITPDPGNYDGGDLKFASDLKKTADMGSKYVFKANSNPGPGDYKPDTAEKIVKPKIPHALIKEDQVEEKRPAEYTPDPGQYQNDGISFAKDLKKTATMGSKYEFKPNSNPPPGIYEVDKANSVTKYTAPSAIIQEEVHTYRRPQHQNPDPSQYQTEDLEFAKGLKKTATMGFKYEFMPNSNPPPGIYDIDAANRQVKHTAQSAIIKEETHPDRRPQHNNPDPGLYQDDELSFGKGLKTTATMGSKYEFKPGSNPPPGLYEHQRADSITKHRSQAAIIKEEVHPDRRPQHENPEPGQYQSEELGFGKNLRHTADMGSKYQFKPDSNPPPGIYDIDASNKYVKYTAPSAIIKEEINQDPRKPEILPDPGQYQGEDLTFGQGLKTTATMGSKYEFKPDKNPPPGIYDIDAANKHIKHTAQSTLIKEETHPERRPQHVNPEPGQYQS